MFHMLNFVKNFRPINLQIFRYSLEYLAVLTRE